MWNICFLTQKEISVNDLEEIHLRKLITKIKRPLNLLFVVRITVIYVSYCIQKNIVKNRVFSVLYPIFLTASSKKVGKYG